MSRVEEFLIGAIENISQGFVIYDSDDRLVYCNKKFREFFSYTDEEAVPGVRFEDLKRIDMERRTFVFEGDDALKHFRHRIEQRGREFGTYVMQMRDGRWLQSREYSTSSGGIVSLQIDVTERVRAQQALKESEKGFRNLIEDSFHGIRITTRDRKPLFANQAFVDMFGYDSAEEILALNSSEKMMAPYETKRANTYREAIFQGEHPEAFEYDSVKKDGSIFRALVNTRLVDWEGQDALQSTFFDVTEQRRQERELLESKLAAEKANRAKSEFLSSMSHELRTPMNAILGFSQLMAGDSELTESQKENVGEVLKAGRHLLDLINEVLDLAKIEAGEITLSPESVLLGEVFEECLPIVQMLVKNRNIEIIDWHSGCMPRPVLADHTRCKQVLLNILTNAIKYNKDGGQVILECWETEDEMVHIAVRDTGIGIPKERVGDLFQPFSRLGVDSTEGTGIGLTITKRLVELMGGRIGFESVEGEGSTFWFELPFAKEESISKLLSGDALTVGPEQTQLGAATVLCVEDNPANLRLLEKIIAAVPGLTMMSAHDAELGLELARESKPDIILMDINLPGMDGYAALNLLREGEHTQSIPVIAISANAMPKDVKKGLKAGFKRYLSKPIDVSKVQEAIQDVLRGEE